METTKMKIEYRKQIDSETAPWQLLTNMDELLWNGIYNLRVADDDGTHSLPFRFANDDTVTLVVKDHAHEGMLENGRTIVQTITRVERSTGYVLSYTRTRYNSNGIPTWTYWTLATEDDAVIEIPKATPVSLGAVIVGDGLAVDADGKLSVAGKSIGEECLISALNDKINVAATKANATDLFVQNSGLALHYGALLQNDAPYPGTDLRVHTDKILSGGEQFVVNDGYVISTLKIFDGEQEIAYANNLSETRYTLDAKGLHYQFEFSKLNMTPFTDDELSQVIKAYQRRPIVWSSAHHINHFVAAGTYNIVGQRTNSADGLPIANAASGHSINARLVVLDSSIPASSKESDKCITQILTLSNRVGGDGDIYVRTGRAADTAHLIAGNGWGAWGKLQQNIEVGQTTSLDAYIDNGIYSGVYTNGTTLFETFVMVVINNYAVAAATGTARSITQLKYAVDTNGVFCYHVRNGQGADTVEWGEWRDLDAVTTDRIQDGAITAEKLSADVVAQINNNTIAISAERTRASEALILKYGRNLFIKDDATVLGLLDTNANLSEFTDWRTTAHYVNIMPNTKYKAKANVVVVIYDADKNFINRSLEQTDYELTTPANACYARFSVYDYQKSTRMVTLASEWNDGVYEEGVFPAVNTVSGSPFVLTSGKFKIATLGDSITYGGNWQRIISRLTGCTFFNNGLSGKTISSFVFHRKQGSATDFDRILTAEDFEGCDAIVICGYANSLWGNMGSMETEYITINADDANSDIQNYPSIIGQNGYIGALRSVIEYLMRICPEIPIIISGQLPMSRAKEGIGGATNSVDFNRVYNYSNKTCAEFSEATKTVAEYYHLPYVDMEKQGQVNILNYSSYYNEGDTTHPNFKEFDNLKNEFPVSGSRQMALLILDALRKVIPL